MDTRDYEEINANEIIADSYVDIAKYVAKTRAYPSILDGMKAVYRRMLFASKDIKGKQKAMEFISATMKYHPHGEAGSVLVSMTEKYGPLPLYIGYGNFGGLGFGASASRYLSAELNDIARIMYLELVDYADKEEGDAGYMEPTYLPSLIPYSLIAGSRGMTVGLPTPEIPSFNLMELIDYFQSKLLGKQCKYPKIDVGDCIIEGTLEDCSDLYEKGYMRIWYKPKFQSTGDSIIITDIPPCAKIEKLLKALNYYIDEEIIDYRDETSEAGYRRVFIINDFNKISMDKLKSIVDKKLSGSVTYRMYFEHNSSVYLCPFDYIVNKSLGYLVQCAIRKFSHEEEKALVRMEVLKALKRLKESGKLENIHEKENSYFRDLIVSWGFSKDVASTVLGKPISYLTKSYDFEYEELEKEIVNYSRLKEDPTEYLVQLYDRLRVLVSDLYNSRSHSVYPNELINPDSLGYKLDNNSLVIGPLRRRYKRFDDSIIYEINSGQVIRKELINKLDGARYELGLENVTHVVGGVRDSKFMIVVVNKSSISVIPIDKINMGDNYLLKLWDDSEISNVYLSRCDRVEFISKSGDAQEIYLPDRVYSRKSYPKGVFPRNKEIVDMKEVN